MSTAFSFAGRLRKQREDMKLSKTALANMIDVTTTCVWNWEEGNTVPRSENLVALAKALNAPIDYLKDGSHWEGAPSGRDVVASGGSASRSLAEIIAEAKIRIAHAAQISPEKVNISLEY